MTESLVRLRARAAYWEKRIALEPTPRRKSQLAVFAWAEIARLAIREGLTVYGKHAPEFERLMAQQVRLFEQERQFQATVDAQFGGSSRKTGSRRRKSSRSRARVVDARHRSGTD